MDSSLTKVLTVQSFYVNSLSDSEPHWGLKAEQTGFWESGVSDEVRFGWCGGPGHHRQLRFV